MTQVFRKLFWTEHSKIKMKQYGLSKQKLLGILYRPERKEQGIAPGTTAVMKTNKSYSNSLQKKKKVEIVGLTLRFYGEGPLNTRLFVEYTIESQDDKES